MKVMCKLCTEMGKSYRGVNLCERHFKKFRSDHADYHLCKSYSRSRRNLNNQILKRMKILDPTISWEDTKIALELYSHQYMGEIEIRKRLAFSLKYYEGFIDLAHENFIKTLRNRYTPPEETDDEFVNIAIACLQKYHFLKV